MQRLGFPKYCSYIYGVNEVVTQLKIKNKIIKVMSKKVNLNPTNSKVINGAVFVTALKALAMSKTLADYLEHGNNITHPTLGLMYQYNGPYSRA